jgi:NADH-quinone oxidoreductase subunit L
VVLVALGIGAGWGLYGRHPRTSAGAPDPVGAAFPAPFAFLGARMKLDELYALTVGRLNSGLAWLADFLDRRVWDGAVRLLARIGEFAGLLNGGADKRGLNAGFDAVSEGIRGAGRTYSRAQSGDAQGYLRALAIGFVVLVVLVLMGCGQ